MALSILHRGTGLALSAGLIVFVYWLLSVASGPAAYATSQAILGSGVLKLCYAGWSFCFFYHLSNGIRHLAWDTGRGFDKHRARQTGWFVVGISLALTVGVWLKPFVT